APAIFAAALIGSHDWTVYAQTAPQAPVQNEAMVETQTSQAACAKDLKRAIADLDRLIDASPRSIKIFDSVRKQMPKGPCSLDEVISIAKTSKFFSSVYDWGTGYTILIATDSIHFSFGIKKDSGVITDPAAIPRCGGRSCL